MPKNKFSKQKTTDYPVKYNIKQYGHLTNVYFVLVCLTVCLQSTSRQNYAELKNVVCKTRLETQGKGLKPR